MKEKTLATVQTSTYQNSYHFIKIWNSDKLPEQIYQPLRTQNDCAVVLDDNAQVMIEIYHGGKLFLVINKALLFGITLKILYIQVMHFLG